MHHTKAKYNWAFGFSIHLFFMSIFFPLYFTLVLPTITICAVYLEVPGLLSTFQCMLPVKLPLASTVVLLLVLQLSLMLVAHQLKA